MGILLTPACAGDGGQPGRPGGARNVILVSVDTLRPDHLASYGYGRVTSPNLDALARRGALFTDVTAAAPWTLPSHASLLTGLYPSRHGVKSHETRLPESIVTLAEEFQTRGFTTLGIVNTHNVGAPQYRLGQGFQRFEYITETEEDARTLRVRTLNMAPLVVSSAQDLLAARDADRPFFLFLHFYDVHTDFTPAEPYREEFVQEYHGKLDGRTQQLNGVRNRGEQLGEEDLRFLREMYDAEIRTFDEVFGQFLAWLEQQGLLEDTLVVVTSDHGEEFQEHGSVLHGRTQYQELLRVPLILAGPGIPSGMVVDTPAHGVDVAPTLLALTGIESSEEHDGVDLSGLWTGGRLSERLLFGEADQDNRKSGSGQIGTKSMVRRGFDKLIHDAASGRTELFDLSVDPEEQRNLAQEREPLTSELGVELERFLRAAIVSEAVARPSPEEQRKLDAMGYGGDGGDDEE